MKLLRVDRILSRRDVEVVVKAGRVNVITQRRKDAKLAEAKGQCRCMQVNI